jgi:ATP-dependent HslUV protease subunit HslV
MSIAVAVKKDNNIVLATDSLASFGSGKMTSTNYQTNKMILAGQSCIALTGWLLYENLMRSYINSLENLPTLNSEQVIFQFFIDFLKKMKADNCFINDQCEDKGSPFTNLDSQFLVVNSSGVFVVLGNMHVLKFNEYCAIGSGSDYALGALYSIYHNNIDANSIAEFAVNTAIELDTSCGGKINFFHVAA